MAGANTKFTPKLGQSFFVVLNFFEHVRKNPGSFVNSNHQYAAGEVIALSKSYASLQFESMLEIVELPIQKFLECLFVKKVPLGSVVFSARDFVVADLDEFLLHSSKCVKFSYAVHC